jgi:YhcH/YjgK/YiaL family protein
VPDFRDFYISNVFCRGAKTAIAITGLPYAPVQKINFDNVVIAADKGYEAKDAKDIAFKNTKVILPGGVVRNLALAPAANEADPLKGLAIQPHASVNRQEFALQYAANKQLWDKAFEFLRSNKLSELAPGKYPLMGDSVFVSVTYGPEKAFEATKWEAHRKYIDLQYIASGKEKMGVAPLVKAKEVMPYNETKDVANYETEGTFHVADSTHFFLFFPQDVHRPNIKVEEGDVRKVVIKILAAPAS